MNLIKELKNNNSKTNINFNPGLTIIWGENGSGKTSILEAIHSLSYGKSFRTNNKTDLIKKGDKNFFIKGFFKNKDSSKNTVTLSQDTTGLKKITINKKPIKKRKELLGLNNVVIFSPEEEEITKGSPVSRRNYFDKIFSICSYSYLNELLSYNKILKQRNSLLRTEKNCNRFGKENQSEQIAMTQLYLYNAVDIVQSRGKEVIISFSSASAKPLAI